MSILFKGDNKALIVSINALLALDAKGALAPHGIGEMARDLLETCAARLPAEQYQGEPVAYLISPPGCSPALVFARDLGNPSKYAAPLYTHADPSDIRVTKQALESLKGEASDLRAQLATWKRRAIEAESKLRTYDPQVVDLGEQAMQALLADPKPSEVVLTKCGLCDQLQDDLTKLDEKLDRTQDLLRYMVYDYRSVVQAGYDRITALGSDCDSVAKMLADNQNYQRALSLLEPKQCGACGGCTNGWQVDKDSPKAEVMDISDLGADAVCGICYDTGHMIIDDTGPEYVTAPCMECEKGQQLATKP